MLPSPQPFLIQHIHDCRRSFCSIITAGLLIPCFRPPQIQKLVNMQSSRGWSPLLNAAENGHEGIVSTLLDHHARVDVFDSEGKAALHLAAEHGYKLVSCGKYC
uniref:Uncharacterized protein n=1 Tax=Scylla olivacea TaxID=85551 RepID=A0A0P4VVP0_SCYOL